MSADELPKGSVVTAKPDATVRELGELMDRQNVGSVVIVDRNETPLGMVTDRDLVLRVLEDVANPGSVRARDVMSEDVVTVEVGEGIFEVIRRMVNGGFRRLPITEDGRLVDIVALDDLLRLLAEEFHELTRIIEAESPRRDLRQYF